MMYQADNRQTVEVARLEDYLSAFRERKWLVLAMASLGVILAFLYSETATASYTAEARAQVFAASSLSPNPANPSAPRLEQESQVVASDRVAVEVEAAFPATNRNGLDVKFTPNSNILVISYTAPTAQQASDIANAFAETYVRQRVDRERLFFQNQIDTTQAQLDEANANQQARNDELDLVQNQRNTEARSTTPSQALLDDYDAQSAVLRADIAALGREITTFESQIRADRGEIVNLEISPPGEVLSQALVPTAPDGIPRPFLLVAGTLLGLTLGLASAFFLERLDTTARDENDVALALGTSVIGAIPTLGMGRLRGSQNLIMFSTGGSARISAAREAFRRLRSSLLFLNSSSGVSSAVVTSSSPGEGKSVTSANLAIALAQNGSRVVLVSADMRRPTLERMFGMEAQRPGLAEYLGQTAELNAEKVPGIENLWLIRSGRSPANPSELLNSDRFELLIKELEREDVEYIIVDSPPLLSTADALSAARFVDGVIVVVDAEKTESSDLLQIRADLERSGARVLGAVLNRRKFDGGRGFRRSKYAYYQAEVARSSASGR